jgi:hypothetical protein
MQFSKRNLFAILTLFTSAGLNKADAEESSNYIFGDGFERPPILWYTFDGDAINSGSASGYTMTLANSSYDVGRFGQAISFGTNGYASVAGMQNLLGVLPQVTVAFWIYESVSADRDYWDVYNRTVAPYGGLQIAEYTGIAIGVCVANATDSMITGSCPFTGLPTLQTWHHWIISYAGTGIGDGKGAPVKVYLDDVLIMTINDDASNNPIFDPGISDVMFVGANGALMDDLRIYDRVMSQAEQCARIINGTWTGANCELP